MKKTLIVSNIILLTTVLILVYLFIIKGSGLVKLEGDNRTTVKYPADVRELILSEMRDYLVVINKIQDGLATDNPKMIVEAATTQGSQAILDTPTRVLKSAPLACKQLGFRGHNLFQAIADSARINFNPKTTQKQLVTLTNNCVTCHRSYKLDFDIK